MSCWETWTSNFWPGLESSSRESPSTLKELPSFSLGYACRRGADLVVDRGPGRTISTLPRRTISVARGPAGTPGLGGLLRGLPWVRSIVPNSEGPSERSRRRSLGQLARLHSLDRDGDFSLFTSWSPPWSADAVVTSSPPWCRAGQCPGRRAWCRLQGDVEGGANLLALMATRRRWWRSRRSWPAG